MTASLKKYYLLAPNSKVSLVLLSCLLVFSCAQKSPPEQQLEKPSDLPDNKPDQTELMNQRYQQGITALSNFDFAKAENIFRDFTKNYPDLSGAYGNLALIQFNQKKNDEALLLIDKAITLNSNNAQAYNLRAQLRLEAGEIHQAKEDYRKAISLKPDYAIAHYNLALLYDIYLQDIERAIQHYEKYLSLTDQPDERTREWVNHLKSMLKNG